MDIQDSGAGRDIHERDGAGGWVKRGVESGLEPAVRNELEGRVEGEGGEYQQDDQTADAGARALNSVGRSLLPGAIAAALTCATVAALGRIDSGSAVAPINASSHVFWGSRAGQVETLTFRETLPGLVINTGASFWWALVFESLFGKRLDRGGIGAAVMGGGATAALAYLVDYKLVPKRLTPGWEQRLTGRSVGISLGAMAVGLALGGLLASRRRTGTSGR